MIRFAPRPSNGLPRQPKIIGLPNKNSKLLGRGTRKKAWKPGRPVKSGPPDCLKLSCKTSGTLLVLTKKTRVAERKNKHHAFEQQKNRRTNGTQDQLRKVAEDDRAARLEDREGAEAAVANLEAQYQRRWLEAKATADSENREMNAA